MVLAITWTLSVLCIIVVAARFAVVRVVARRGWGADDWIMLLAAVCHPTDRQINLTAMILSITDTGFSNHLRVLYYDIY